jgi:metal-responsive CopG/Arc/MetJ family transcriptional regulator
MPRPGPRRPVIALRLGDEVTQRVDERADDEDVNRSEAIRLLIEYGLEHMPKGWRPAPS